MKKFALLLAVLFAWTAATAQEVIPQPKNTEDDEIFVVVEQDPEFPGGMEAMVQYLSSNIKYPQEAMEKSIQGTVYVTFVVEKDGKVNNIRVIRKIGGGCDEEAVRVVQAMPKWKPGKQRGKAVRVQYNLPIKFQLK